MEKLATNSRYGHFQLQGLSVLDDNTLHSLAGGKDCPLCDAICDMYVTTSIIQNQILFSEDISHWRLVVVLLLVL